MPFNTQDLEAFQTQFLNAFAAATGITPIPGSGSPIVGLADAQSENCMFLQYQAQYTNNFARLQTCTGPDVDSFCAQFNFFREGAQFASGQVTLSVPTAQVTQLVIPIGTIVQTTGSSIQYQLVADTGQASYSPSLQAYILPSSSSSAPVLTITASVQALVAGSASNVQIGQLVAFGTSSYGFTGVTNLAPISNGADQETDAALKNRFEEYIQSLSKGTFLAILEACQTAFPEFTYTILNNTTPFGAIEPGWFTVIANNPGETVTSPQLAALLTAVQAVRAFTIQASVIAAIPVKPNINLNVSVIAGSNTSSIESAVQTAVIGYVNNLPTSAKLYISNLIDVAINTSTLITSVELSSVTIGGVPRDFQPTGFAEVVQADVLTVDIGAYAG